MESFYSQRSTQDYVESRLSSRFVHPRYSALQATQAMIQKTFQSDHMFSDYLAQTDIRERNRRIDEMVRNGSIPEDVADMYMFYRPGLLGGEQEMVDYDGLAKYARDELQYEDMQDDTEMMDQIRAETAEIEERAAEAFAQQGIGGKVLAMGGGLIATLTDPVYAFAGLTGFGNAVWAARLAKGYKTSKWVRAASITGIETAAETAKQSRVLHWKKEVGIDYDMGDAMTEILFTAAGVGIMSSADAVLKIRKFNAEAKASGAPDDVIAGTEDVAKTLEDANQPDLDAVEVSRGIEAAHQKIASTRARTAADDFAEDATRARESEIAEGIEAEAKHFEENYGDEVIYKEVMDETAGKATIVPTTLAKEAEEMSSIRRGLNNFVQCLVTAA